MSARAPPAAIFLLNHPYHQKTLPTGIRERSERRNIRERAQRASAASHMSLLIAYLSICFCYLFVYAHTRTHARPRSFFLVNPSIDGGSVDVRIGNSTAILLYRLFLLEN